MHKSHVYYCFTLNCATHWPFIMHGRLSKLSSSRLKSPIILSEWSSTIDVIALTYSNYPDVIELRRMDWTKVNSIKLETNVSLFCFDSNGRNLCVATDDKRLSLYSIESCQLLSSNSFDSEITAICFGKYYCIDITAIACEDLFLYVLSGFHLMLCKIKLPLAAIKLTLDGLNLFAVLEDYVTISHFKLDSLEDNFAVIQLASKNLSEYWNNYQVIQSKMKLINE